MKKELVVYLVDDHTLFREGIKFLLSNWDMIKEIHEAEDGALFLKELAVHQPDIVLMDINMPVMNGIETTKKAIERFPDLKIIALSMYGEEAYYTDMIDAGAKGFLQKDSKFEHVKQAILDVNEGKSYFSPEIFEAIIKNINKKKDPEKPHLLSTREVEVLFNICKGLSNIEIAERLFISKRTVDKHRENILQKTASRNTAEMVVFAIKNGYFEI